MPCLTEPKQLTSASLMQNFSQRVTSRHTVDANKLLVGSCQFRKCITSGGGGRP